jgi:hypothetical protein
MFHKARGGLCPGEGDERTMRAGEFARNCLLTCEETRENHTRIQNDVARVVLCRGALARSTGVQLGGREPRCS